ncbi:MAG: glycosyltransferase family 1 protein [Candidatus Acidulodesulfobacterium acidiphilum]|uniref:Glycosyltransferase family 1 protein n=1 Tax=Candidatus Acidulodesulfobacterium acidiphilum TaxID=2597224 RepID=A0A520XC67_9DELT|nr:MAG: glycosyltransferase family 1 protein [Candidatus Acidulodesulfobacterium acidiphilum]
MKIFFDARLINYAGLGRYERELIAELLKLNPDITFYVIGEKDKITSYINDFKLNPKNFVVIDLKIKKYTFSEQFKLINIIRNMELEKKVDIFLFPHFNVPFLYIPKNSAVIVHDLTFFHFPRYFGRIKTMLAKLVLKNVLIKAKKIITVSNFVKNDIINMFGSESGKHKNSKLDKNILQDKITVVYSGYSPKFKPASENKIKEFKIKNNLDLFILYCGNRKKHKNIINLIKAFREVKKEFADLKLILIGKRFEKPNKQDFIDEFINKNGVKDVISVEYASDDDLNLYYSASSAFVFISLSEGFGFAPLEALASGTKLILADNSALPEIFGNSAVYVNPYDINDIAGAIKKILKLSPNNKEKQEQETEDKYKSARETILNSYPNDLWAKNILKVLNNIKPNS